MYLLILDEEFDVKRFLLHDQYFMKRTLALKWTSNDKARASCEEKWKKSRRQKEEQQEQVNKCKRLESHKMNQPGGVQ
jgi:hypothetical protein